MSEEIINTPLTEEEELEKMYEEEAAAKALAATQQQGGEELEVPTTPDEYTEEQEEVKEDEDVSHEEEEIPPVVQISTQSTLIEEENNQNTILLNRMISVQETAKREVTLMEKRAFYDIKGHIGVPYAAKYEIDHYFKASPSNGVSLALDQVKMLVEDSYTLYRDVTKDGVTTRVTINKRGLQKYIDSWES